MPDTDHLDDDGVRGGQGRSDDSVRSSSDRLVVIGWIVLALAAAIGVSLVWYGSH
jgi:hypothetical protein